MIVAVEIILHEDGNLLLYQHPIHAYVRNSALGFACEAGYFSVGAGDLFHASISAMKEPRKSYTPYIPVVRL